MSWERRLREMVLAGGAFAVACGGACGEWSSSDGSSGGSSSSSGGSSSGGACCNANGDPCCGYLYCGDPLTAGCSAELACKADGGTYNLYTEPVACSFPDASASDGGEADGDGGFPQCTATQACVGYPSFGDWACLESCSGVDAGDCPSGQTCTSASGCCVGTACSAVIHHVCVGP